MTATLIIMKKIFDNVKEINRHVKNKFNHLGDVDPISSHAADLAISKLKPGKCPVCAKSFAGGARSVARFNMNYASHQAEGAPTNFVLNMS
jgi:hypothetical protein